MLWSVSKRRVTVILVIYLLLFATLLGVATYKPSIHNATIEELQEIYGLGELLSERVVVYLESNPTCEIEDLIEVDGIGKIKLKSIKKEWR